MIRYNDREAKEAGCFELQKCVAKRKVNNERVSIEIASKNLGPFYCPGCFSDAIVKKGLHRTPHFAHIARLSSMYSKNESLLHKACKEEICSALRRHFPEGKWDVERAIKAIEKEKLSALRPDISGRINNIPIMIEIQVSDINLKSIIHRVQEYTKRKGNILWIIPLKEELGQELFRPRLQERFIHAMYFGRVYYWLEGYGSKVLPVHYSPAQRWIEETSWFEEGEERSGGGYWQTYKVIKKPLPGDLVDIATDFFNIEGKEYVMIDNKVTVPKRKIYIDRHKKWWKEMPYPEQGHIDDYEEINL